MAFTSEVKSRKPGFAPGYGIIIDLEKDLPRKYDANVFGDGEGKGLVLTGNVVSVLGARDSTNTPVTGEYVSVTVRSGDNRKTVFDDLSKTNEGTRFLLEGVTVHDDQIEARWAHGAGSNRHIRASEIVGVPHVTFEIPEEDDGPYSGNLRLNLDGSPTVFDELIDGEWFTREFSFETVVARLKTSLDRNLKFRVSQRVLFPSLAVSVNGQESLEQILTQFREAGYTSSVVRTYIPGTTDPGKVDVQVLSWPEDIPARDQVEAKVYEMPVLKETRRFASLRDGEDIAQIEVIPGYVVSLVGNPDDPDKSVKHKFVRDIVVKGLSDGQKKMYAAQAYGPGIEIRAVNEDSVILGLTRLITRTEGQQYRNLLLIPTAGFPEANKLDFSVKDKTPEVPESGADTPAS